MFTQRLILIGASHYAKMMCSGLFLSARGVKALVDKEIAADLNGLLEDYKPVIDRKRGVVSASLFGLGNSTAIYRAGLGCTLLVEGVSEAALRAQVRGVALSAPKDTNARIQAKLWPDGNRVEPGWFSEGVDRAQLAAAVMASFQEPDKKRQKRVRALLIVHNGRIVVEQYAQKFTPATRMQGWGLVQGVVNALAGIMVGEGKLKLDDRELRREWSKPGDARANITFDQLLRMTSGLQFAQSRRNPYSDLNAVMFLKRDIAAYAASRPADSRPGSKWAFSSGSTAIASNVMRHALGGSQSDYFTWPRRALFGPLGMDSAVFEPDAAGTFAGSNSIYATARDWARLGLF